ncbi:MAG: transposase [Bacillota bacterium]|nr:transposase [Bacillota bacterium]
MDITVCEGIKHRFKDGAICPHCGSRKVIKHGFFKGKQRYKCKECKKTFNLFTNTLLSWSHYKEKWESFIKSMGDDITLRQAEKEIGVSYVTLFYWRHKIMSILDETNDNKLHGVLEMTKMNFSYLNKYHPKEENEDEFEKEDNIKETVCFTFIYQRDARLESFIYKDRKGARSLIEDIAYNIDKNSIICLNNNYPFRFPLIYKKFKVAETGSRKYKRRWYYNADQVKKYITMFKIWMTPFRGVSSKYLTQYSSYFKTNKIFNTMKYIIMSYLRESRSIKNSSACCGTLGF